MARLAAVAAAEREVDAIVAQPVGVLKAPLELDHFHECGIGNLTADALRERMGADVALVCSGQFHQGLPAGTITLGQLDRACFTTANPCATEVRGAQIVAALERGLDPAVSQFKHHGFRGTPMGILQISGMVVEYDPDAQVGQRVQGVVLREGKGGRTIRWIRIGCIGWPTPTPRPSRRWATWCWTRGRRRNTRCQRLSAR